MENQEVIILSVLLRELMEDILEDLYDNETDLSDLSNEEKIDYIIDFLVDYHPDEKKYFNNYKKFIDSEISIYKKFIIGFLITDFYEYQTVIKDRGRQSEEFAKYYKLIERNFNNPEYLKNLFMSCKNIEFNRAIVDNYIMFQDENKAFFFQAIKKQIQNKNVKNLNKINPFYIYENGLFLANNKITIAEEITEEIVQAYYDEFSMYIENQATEIDDFDDEYSIEEDDLPNYIVNENDEIEFIEDFDDVIEEKELTINEEDIIYRLLKLRIIQKYIQNDNNRLFDVISYIIGNVYENIIFEANNFSKELLLRHDIYMIINDGSVEEVIKLFINDDDFSTLVLKYFVEYNEYEDIERSVNKREYIEDGGYDVKIKKFNKHYNEENESLKDY